MTTFRRVPVHLLVAVCLLTAACGAKSPAAPTDTTTSKTDPASNPVPASGGGSATIAGTVVAPGASIVAIAFANGIPGVKVTVVGTSMTAMSDSGGHFSLTTVPGGDQQLQFDDNGREARVVIPGIGEREDIQITVSLSGTVAEVTEQERSNGTQTELEGRISAVDASARTMQVRGVTVTVPQGVVPRKGNQDVGFNVLQVGDRVHVRGTKSGAGVTATEVIVQQSEALEVELSGTISDAAGTCPGKTFHFGSTLIAVNAATAFTQGACDDIADGRQVEVKGVRRTDGSVLAGRLHFEDTGPPPAGGHEGSARGIVAGLSGQCPALHFTIGSVTVTTTAATVFAKVTCEALKNGANVEVEGTLTGTSLSARKVQAEDDEQEASANGIIGGLAGTCPVLSFTVQGQAIVTTASTEFKKVTCETLTNGLKVEVEGKKEGGVLAAKKVQAEQD